MNRTETQLYIEALLGPQRSLSLSWLIPLTVVYIIILIIGVIGNVITILVIFRFRYMQTITNLYLCNLAITDLITLICGEYSYYTQINSSNPLNILFILLNKMHDEIKSYPID